MAGNFLDCAGSPNWNDLPAACTNLVALCAPRRFIIGGSN
jgi:hypothetical protein